jgi:PIN domain nuclease of toxin-antitoxin system
MKLLLDTHTFIWLDTAPEKLSPTALAACEAPDNELYFSVVSAWEIQIKAQLGRLALDVPLSRPLKNHLRLKRIGVMDCDGQ